MLDIQLEGLDNETRMKLLPREQGCKRVGTKWDYCRYLY